MNADERRSKKSACICVYLRPISPVIRSLTVAALLLLWAAAGVAQTRPAPGGPEFAVSTTRSYQSGERPRVALYYRAVNSLDFRVYRVADPVALLGGMKNPHQFGEARRDLMRVYRQAPPAPIETIHTFKRDLRSGIRGYFRSQLSAKTRQAYSAPPPGKVQRPQRVVLNASSFAEVPLLNPKRLTVAWHELLPFSAENQRAVFPVDVKEPGVYVIEAVNGRLAAYAVLVMTDLAVVTKSAPGQMLVYTVDRRSGRPAANAEIFLYRTGRRLTGGRADARGLFLTPLKIARGQEPSEPLEEEDQDEVRGGVGGVLAMARAGGRFAVSALEQYEVPSGPETEYRAYIYTDRPVYRPGHKIEFKGIVRLLNQERYNTPGGRVEVQITGPERTPLLSQTFTLNQYGSFSGAYEVPPEASLGYYSIRATLDGKMVGMHGFRVEEYRKPEFEVKVAVERGQYLQGESLRASVSARYYFGAPVSGGKVSFHLFRSRYIPPFWMDYLEEEGSDEGGGEETDSEYGRRYYSPPEQVHQPEATLDADGKAQIELPTEIDPGRQNFVYHVQAEVTDAGDRQVSGAGYAQVLYSDLGVFGQTDRYVYKPAETVETTFRALDLQGKPQRARLEVTLLRQQWMTNRSQNVELKKTAVDTDASGVARFSFQPDTPGSFIVRGETKDTRGRVVQGQVWCWVAGRDFTFGGEGYGISRIRMIPDKKKYKAGDTARVLLSLPESGKPERGAPDSGAHLLITTEGRQVYSAWVAEADSPSLTVDVPITPQLAPNFYLAVAYVKNNRLYEASQNINVPSDEKKLSVEISSDQSQYRPGQPAAYTVLTRDAAGRPVSAEVSLGVVDEAIYAIQPENAADIYRFFFPTRYSRVITRYSRDYYFYGYSGEKRMQLVFARRPYQLADFKAEGEKAPAVRRRFVDTAYWNAQVVTDGSGRGQVRFDMPDNLTTWRATARAVTADTRVGSTVQKVLARKNLMLRLQTPRFFTQRDSATVVGVVHNYLASDKTLRVSLEATGIDVAEGAARSVTVPKNGQARIEWRVYAPGSGEAVFLAKALGDEESDAMEWRVPVRPYGAPITQARSGTISGDQTVVERFNLPAAYRETGTLRIDVSPSAAGTLLGALDFLTTFPYGCVEQTMSSFVPNVVVARTIRELKLPPLARPDELDRRVKAGLKRLYAFQHQDGGWGWWTDDATHPFMTAYVMYGLREAQLAGYEVRADVLRRGLMSLANQLAAGGNLPPDTRAYMSYALVSAAPQAPIPLDTLLESRAQLGPLGKALLALALSARRDPRAMDLAADLERAATTSGGEAWWESRTDPMLLHEPRGNPVQASAYAIKALAQLRPGSPLLPAAVRWLIGHRRGGYYWDTTLNTATVIYGITDYLRHSQELEPNFQVEVLLNGQPLVSRAMTRADAVKLQPVTLRINAGQLAAGENELQIRKRGPGVLYWSAVATYFSGEATIGAIQRADLQITREFFRVLSEKRGDRYIYREEPLEGPVRVGDMLSVRVRISGRPYEYLMIEDPIPAGFEAVERDDVFQFERAPEWYASPWWTRRELRDDRVAFFQTALWGRNEANYRYLLRASTAGDFQVMPARVQPMYQPEVQASTANTRVSVQ